MIVYIKHNLHRRRKLQLITTIEKEGNKLYAYKKATDKESDNFLKSLFSKYDYLTRKSFPLTVIKPVQSKKGIRFDYLDYKSFDTMLFEAVQQRDGELIKKIFVDYKKLLDKIPVEKTFVKNNESEHLFGKQKNNKKVECLTIGCLDVILENIFIDGGKYYLLDYEWTFEFPIPKKYIIFRTILNSYFKYWAYNISKIVSTNTILKEFNITKEEKDVFLDMEWNFQHWATGKVVNLEKYKSYNHSILYDDYHIKTIFDEVTEKRDLEEIIADRDDRINKLESKTSELSKSLSQANEEIATMKHSKFWKARNFYIRITRVFK
jgi:hypothetical protein